MAEDTLVTEIKFALSQDESIEVEIDIADLPEVTINRLLTVAAPQFIRNSVNAAHTRWVKDGKDESKVPDYADIASKAKERLLSGDIRDPNGEGKAKTTKSPLDAVVTTAVIRDVFTKAKAKDAKAKYTDAVKKVGASGIAYLEKLAGGDADKLKMIESKYLKPARTMLGIDKNGNPLPVKDEEDGDDLL